MAAGKMEITGMDSRRALLVLDSLFWLAMFLTAALMAFLD